ncbi:general secretion pathway protein GspN [Lysobacter sp. GX 14042]|uniref:general secretion pathway protein GspN n=1 Tax=Lysobacter sp. GX 14042 TaxID=2907155 RepID=UPI001F45F69A|nr:general secretion pathway protein GspN [Lysobacter sp. GX 14042]MCE7032750.1 general secretion pathway protein GspN [Lysobacter sp. GX 14042]
MRLEHAGPRTRLLAVLAGVAVLAWVATLSGLGGRVTPLADDPSLLPALPDPGTDAAPALEPLSAYAVIAERPLFSMDRTPRPFFLAGRDGEPTGGGFDYQLTSVMLTPSLRMAILQPAGGGEPVRVREGAAPPGAPDWRLAGLDRRSAVFEGPDGRLALGLRVFDGSGGSASPEPVATEMDADSSDADAEPAADADAAANADAAARAVQPDAAQVDAIRQRIQARRARLQQQAGQ